MSGLKSAWELSLEKSDKLVPELKDQKKLTAAQKKDIAEIKNEYKAKIADKDVNLQHKLKRLTDRVPPESLGAAMEELTREFHEEKASLEKELEEKLNAVRRLGN